MIHKQYTIQEKMATGGVKKNVLSKYIYKNISLGFYDMSQPLRAR